MEKQPLVATPVVAVSAKIDVAGQQEWQTGLLSCDRSPGDCLCAIFLPNCATAGARRDYDSSNYLFNCLCLTPCIARSLIREGYGIEGNCVNDVVLSCACMPCAIAQFQEEVKRRGPVHFQTGQEAGGDWSHSSLGCKVGHCCYSLFLPQCAAASARTRYDHSNWFLNLLALTPCMARNIIREGYGIEGSWLGDVCCTTALYPCALTQMLREVDARGPVTSKTVTVAVVQPTKML